MSLLRSAQNFLSPRKPHVAQTLPQVGYGSYPEDIETIREREYPALKGTTYLDHSGTTLYAKSSVESYTADLTANIFGNPHSASSSSQLSSNRINNVRLQVLRFLQADPDNFDVIFVANATAAIKLVADALRDYERGFSYGYHADAHTSLVGVQELASLGSTCFYDDTSVEKWIADLKESSTQSNGPMLFSFPGQSNMTGRRLPYKWCGEIRSAAMQAARSVLTLFDAAALASTSPISLSDVDTAPDFTALSFYKIFGFPDLGALIVRKASGNFLCHRRYFGGGTVDMLSVGGGDPWHVKKTTLHSRLEDGTLPFHNIIALEHALNAHNRIYGSMENIADHTSILRTRLYEKMSQLKHNNGTKVCRIYCPRPSDASSYGPVIAFNLLDSSGNYVSNSDVEKLGIVNNLQFRTGGLCNPGGISRHLGLTTQDMKSNYAMGHRCGSEDFFLNGRPTGVIRVSLGAMSSKSDVDKFIEFLKEFYIVRNIERMPSRSSIGPKTSRYYIKSMSVFPIKSCSAFEIPANIDWQVMAKGLAWDREWCIVQHGTNTALSQKRYPRMALIQPKIDLEQRLMVVSYVSDAGEKKVRIRLDDSPTQVATLQNCQGFKQGQSMVCGENVPVHIYTSPEVNEFFSEALGTTCALARHSPVDAYTRLARLRKPKSRTLDATDVSVKAPEIKLSNESPILMVSQSSVNRLNEQIRQARSLPQEILPGTFRGNVVVAERISSGERESPYEEDSWKNVEIGPKKLTATFDVLGPCQRCQMVGVDQANAKRRQEPFNTLAKTRRWDGGIWFGLHLTLVTGGAGQQVTLRVGDPVRPS